MPNTVHNEAITNRAAAVDAFMTLSKVYLTSIERLSALNLDTAREAIKGLSSATAALAEKKAGHDANSFIALMGQPMLERAMAYSRSTAEILAKTQQEMSKVITGQLSHSQSASPGMPGWGAMQGNRMNANIVAP